MVDNSANAGESSRDTAKMTKRPDSLAVGGSEHKNLVAKPRNKATLTTNAVAKGSCETNNSQVGDGAGTGNRSSQVDLPETADLVGRCTKSHARRCAINSIVSTTMAFIVICGVSIDVPIISCSSLGQDRLMGRVGRLDSLGRANLMNDLLPQRQQQQQQHYPSSVSRQATHLPTNSITGDGLEKLLRDGFFGDSHTSGARVRRHIALENARSGARAVNYDGAMLPNKAAKSAATGIALVERNLIPQSSSDSSSSSSSSSSSATYPIEKIEPLDSAFNLQQGDDPNELYNARERILNSLRDTSRKYVLATVRDPVILIHKLQGLIQDIAWSMLEELKSSNDPLVRRLMPKILKEIEFDSNAFLAHIIN